MKLCIVVGIKCSHPPDSGNPSPPSNDSESGNFFYTTRFGKRMNLLMVPGNVQMKMTKPHYLLLDHAYQTNQKLDELPQYIYPH